MEMVQLVEKVKRIIEENTFTSSSPNPNINDLINTNDQASVRFASLFFLLSVDIYNMANNEFL